MVSGVAQPGLNPSHPDPFEIVPVSRHIWETKYRFDGDATGRPGDHSISGTWKRIAVAAAAAEQPGSRADWAERFEAALTEFVFLPGGRIIAGAGTGRAVTLFNCFVMGDTADDLGAIFDGVKDAALTMQQGGGIGQDFSTLRPKGAVVQTLGADASGPVSFMDVWDAMCRTIMSAGARRGAMMGTLRCDHPDIEQFIAAKSDPTRLRNFNLSVLVTDTFIKAVREDQPWDLVFGGTIYRTVKARDLWDQVMQSTYDYAEPGVVFIDRVNAANNLAYCEAIHCTNPCGEQPLPAFGACLLGSLNLARLVQRPFTVDAEIDTARLESFVRIAVRLLDNVIDISNYPLDAQRAEAHAKRRIGLGITGLADALILCGANYDSDEGLRRAEQWMQIIQNTAYLASAELAQEKGSFPLYDAAEFCNRPNILRLEAHVQVAIRTHGVRNGCLTSIAPTGTISLLAGNVSSGIEPVFNTTYQRRILSVDGSTHLERVEDYAYALLQRQRQADERGPPNAPLPDTFVTAQALPARAHLRMQARLQPWVDSSISKTINCAQDITFDNFKSIYLDAYDLGLKGCTTYRPNAVTGAVLCDIPAAKPDTQSNSTAPEATVTQETTLGPPAAAATRHAAERVIYMTEPLERSTALPGYTYKLKWPGNPDALYLTVNDIIQDGRRRPFEIFINTKNLEHYAWTVALTRMISAIFRRGGDVSFVVDELKAIFDPQGGRWVEGRYVPSLLAAIGETIEAHMMRTGFLPNPALRDGESLPGTAEQSVAVGGVQGKAPASGNIIANYQAGKACPQCGQRGMRRIEGCWSCPDCGFSHCG